MIENEHKRFFFLLLSFQNVDGFFPFHSYNIVLYDILIIIFEISWFSILQISYSTNTQLLRFKITYLKPSTGL